NSGKIEINIRVFPSTSSAPVVKSRAFANTEKAQYKTTQDGVTVQYTAQGGVSLVYLPPRLRGGIGFISDLLDDLHQPINESEHSDPGPTKMEFLLAWLPASPAENGLESGTNPRLYFVKDPSKPTAQQWGLNPSVLNSLLISVESLQTAIETAEASASLFARVTPFHIDSDHALRDRMTEQVTRIMRSSAESTRGTEPTLFIRIRIFYPDIEIFHPGAPDKISGSDKTSGWSSLDFAKSSGSG
ncbi:hypothetical protein DL93DRAFT_2201647, partial [Clavulina sp. PMI_390]